MTDEHAPRTEPPPQGMPEAKVRKTWWPGWIWAIPIAAIGVVIWLLVRSLSSGVEVTLLLPRADGISPGNTDVTYRGMHIGSVDDLTLSPDGQHVAAKLNLDGNMKRYLTTGTRFWVKGAAPSLADPSSLKAIISGPVIVMSPGNGTPTRSFTALPRAPALEEPQDGRSFTMVTSKDNGLDVNSGIYYLGRKVGVITDRTFTAPSTFTFTVFVDSPFDKLVGAQTRFWNASAVTFASESGGLSAQLLSLEALTQGAVAFEDSARFGAGNTQQFTLYDSKDAAEAAPAGIEVPFMVALSGDVGELKPGAPVKMRGFTVGRVSGVTLAFDAHSRSLSTSIVIGLQPDRFEAATAQAQPVSAAAMTEMIKTLVHHGLRARMSQAPPLIGGAIVALDLRPGAAPKDLVVNGQYAQIPADSSSDINDAIAKVSAIPLDEIGQNVRTVTAQLRRFVSSPKLDKTLADVQSTIDELNKAVSDSAPRIDAVVKSLQKAATELDATATSANEVLGGDPAQDGGDFKSALGEITQAARALRSLAASLDRHPEAIIKGK